MQLSIQVTTLVRTRSLSADDANVTVLELNEEVHGFGGAASEARVQLTRTLSVCMTLLHPLMLVLFQLILHVKMDQ